MTTDARLSRPRPETLPIERVVKWAEEGRLRIPHFQRPFVWTSEDVRKLADSIWRGYPIGSLLFWERPAEADTVHVGPLQLEVEERADAWWVVDGQQRVSSLVGLFSQQTAGIDRKFEVYFDLRADKVVTGRASGAPLWWLPLRQALDTKLLLRWLDGARDELASEEYDLALDVGTALRDYRILAYVVEEADVETLRHLFDRVNTAGKPIKRTEVFHALFALETEPGSPAAVSAAVEHLGWGTIPPNRVLQSLLALRGGDIQRDIRNEFKEHEDPAEAYAVTEAALGRAIDFLRRQGIPHLFLLPQELPLPVLAAFFHLHPEPARWIEHLLARWLWRGFVHGFGSSGQTPALRQAIYTLHPTRSGEHTPSEFEAVAGLLALVPDLPAPESQIDQFRPNERGGLLGLLALVNLNPTSPTGDAVDLGPELEEHGRAAITAFTAGPRSTLANRGFWPIGHDAPSGDEEEAVLASHAIDPAAAAAVRLGDSAAFIAARTATLESLILRFLAVRLEHGAPVRRPLSDLIVNDDEIEPELEDQP